MNVSQLRAEFAAQYPKGQDVAPEKAFRIVTAAGEVARVGFNSAEQADMLLVLENKRGVLIGGWVEEVPQ